MIFNLTEFTGHFIDIDKIGSNPIVLDMGANNGDTVKQLFELLPNAKIYAYECNKKMIEEFKETYQHNKDVYLIEKAVVGNDYPKTAEFHDYINYPFHGTVSGLTYEKYFFPDKPATMEKYQVETININEIMNEFEKVDYLKMDIAGTEKGVFNSITTENLRKIKQMSIECINGEYAFEITKLLIAIYYVIIGIGDIYAIRKY